LLSGFRRGIIYLQAARQGGSVQYRFRFTDVLGFVLREVADFGMAQRLVRMTPESWRGFLEVYDLTSQTTPILAALGAFGEGGWAFDYSDDLQERNLCLEGSPVRRSFLFDEVVLRRGDGRERSLLAS
jgi:hypothetical protein